MSQQDKDDCRALTVWKVGLELHIIYFFFGLSFSVGAVKSQDDNEAVLHQTERHEKFGKVMDASMLVCRNLCLAFCGPFILLECVLSAVYYNSIMKSCSNSGIDTSMRSLLVYILIIFGITSLVTTVFCFYWIGQGLVLLKN